MSVSNKITNIKTVAVKLISTDEVVPDPSNPACRTTKTALSPLKKSIQENGIITPLEAIRHNDMAHLVNGHRRLAVAKDLDIGRVPVRFIDWPWARRHELWKLTNNARSVNTQEWAEYHFKSDKKMALPSRVKPLVESMVRIWGEDRACDLVVNEHVSPHIVKCIGQIRVRLVEVPSAGAVSDREIGDWLIKHRMQNSVNALFRQTKPPAAVLRKLATCIQRDKPFDIFGKPNKGTVVSEE